MQYLFVWNTSLLFGVVKPGMPFVSTEFLAINYTKSILYRRYILSFDGTNFKSEPSSNYPHYNVNKLGVFKTKPFVTGSYYPANKKTEILDHVAEQWKVVADYPFSSGDR